jgi:hypothetical protein
VYTLDNKKEKIKKLYSARMERNSHECEEHLSLTFEEVKDQS